MGKHAITANINIFSLPKRQTDNSYILNKEKYIVKFYTTDGGIKCVKREENKVERQHRMHIGSLTVAYTLPSNNKFVYILEEAFTSFDEAIAIQGILVPPCIMQIADNKVKLLINLEDVAGQQKQTGIHSISADTIIYTTKNKFETNELTNEILHNFQEYLCKRPSQLKLLAGTTPMQKLLIVEKSC